LGAVHTLSDQQLVSLLREGNQDAYIEIYDRYKVILQQHACKKLDNLDEVEDIHSHLGQKGNIKYNDQPLWLPVYRRPKPDL